MMIETVYDNNGNVIEIIEHTEIAIPDWVGFKTAFSTNIKWIEYGNNNPTLASMLIGLSMQNDPDVDAINRMVMFMKLKYKPSDEALTEWQVISNRYNTNINFI